MARLIIGEPRSGTPKTANLPGLTARRSAQPLINIQELILNGHPKLLRLLKRWNSKTNQLFTAERQSRIGSGLSKTPATGCETVQNPKITFNEVAEKSNKSVSLKVTDSDGFSCLLNKSITVNVKLPEIKEVAPKK